MRSLARLTILLAILAPGSFARPTSPAQDPKETGTITGRVTLDGKPAQGVNVIATPSGSEPARMVERMLNPSASSKATTDSAGRYRLEGVPAGTYIVSPSAPTLVSLEAEKAQKEVTVGGDATVERIDFSLARGGVITGKVTESDGHPAIAAFIALKPVGNAEAVGFYAMQNDRMFFSDDRGVYRIFGLPAGRYLVSAGNSDNSPFGQLFTGQHRVKTYYPGVTDEPSAKPVEVTAAGEAVGIDIKLGVATKGFVVSGRIIESETRKPVANMVVTYGASPSHEVSNKNEDEDDNDGDDDDDSLGSLSGFTMTNAKGEFRLESVAPGKFQARANSMGAVEGTTDFYTDPVEFEVRGANVENLEMQVHRGASISGVVVVENPESGEAHEKIGQLVLNVAVADAQTRSFSSNAGSVAADGSFRVGGLKAGKARIDANSFGAQRLSVLRIERNGVDQQDGLLVQPNEQITGVRVIVIEANCVIRGHVIFQGGSPPPGSVTSAVAMAMSGTRGHGQSAGQVDSKGDFVIENLAPGSYEVVATTYVAGSEGAKRVISGKQTVSVTSGIPTDISLVLDLSAKERDK